MSLALKLLVQQLLRPWLAGWLAGWQQEAPPYCGPHSTHSQAPLEQQI